ncbi:uncharacterized protein LOC106870904 [Octopus bimaculoides]|uniref:uncharacterized protein LOC106870904 n=1 Tax=Octopus bimaculoides TaxID=37653 RepID=UPI0022E0D16C|nr:uncharacterized protein LOC106870904 [Octopus bimaculoides]
MHHSSSFSVCCPCWRKLDSLTRAGKLRDCTRFQSDLAKFLQLDALPNTNHSKGVVTSIVVLVAAIILSSPTSYIRCHPSDRQKNKNEARKLFILADNNTDQQLTYTELESAFMSFDSDSKFFTSHFYKVVAGVVVIVA